MKVIQNFTIDLEQVEALESFKEKTGKNKSYLIREFIKYFALNKEEFEKLIKDGELNEQNREEK